MPSTGGNKSGRITNPDHPGHYLHWSANMPRQAPPCEHPLVGVDPDHAEWCHNCTTWWPVPLSVAILGPDLVADVRTLMHKLLGHPNGGYPSDGATADAFRRLYDALPPLVGEGASDG